LEALAEIHYKRGKEGDVQSGMLYVKLSERRATTKGLNAPQNHHVEVTTPPAKQNTTMQAREVHDMLMHITPRESELINRHDDGHNDPKLIGEINDLRAARGQPALPRHRASIDQVAVSVGPSCAMYSS
jgi:hypothetical protein